MTVHAPTNGLNGFATHRNGSAFPGLPRPGKTAPRLIHDALLLDTQAPQGQRDVLAHPSDFFVPDQGVNFAEPDAGCHHQYALKRRQSHLPPSGYRAGAGDEFYVDACCRNCRQHFRASIKYSPTGRRPCPNQDFPVHHFLVPANFQTGEYTFACSSADCQSSASIQYHAPVISPSDLDLLTNPNLLRKRYDDTLDKHADRSGFVPPTPVSTLWKFRRYIRDCLRPDAAGKKIPTQNKRYLEAFAADTDELFRRLGFRPETIDEEEYLHLPQIGGNDNMRTFLENWDMELQALIDQYAARDGDLNPAPDYVWEPVRDEFNRLLAAQDYKRAPQAQHQDGASAQDHPYYASLGAMRDFHDDLVAFSYDRQSDCDPEHGPYYFDCLQDLAQGRQSEDLAMKASLLESQGVTGQKAVMEAYRYFGLHPNASLSDEQIANVYRSRLQDMSPSSHHEIRAMLSRLGTARQSQLLIDTASETIETYQQALSWLGAESDYPDDSILTLHTTKVADNSANEKLARRAVEIIANARNSDPLRSWLSTGEMRDSGMSVDDACKHLNIKLDTVDDTTLQLVIDGAKRDNPGWKTDQAIEVVTKAYQRPRSGPAHDPSEWPVGLTSHGNTCYLNSLLQYYFTIKPLRDLVLNFDEYKFDLAAHPNGKIQRVGARKVAPLEIRAYQKFVDDLSFLFIRMIKDRGPAVKPEADLVCRAFLKAEDTESQTAPTSQTHSPTSTAQTIDIPPPKPPRPVSDHESPPKFLKRTPSDASSATLAGPDEGVPDKMITSQILPDTPPGTPPMTSGDAATDSDALHVPPLPPRPTSTPIRQQTNLAKAEDAAKQQQDVTEVMDEILFRLRCAINPDGQDSREEQLDAFRKIFYMRISEKTLVDAGKIQSKEEYAMNILLNIPSRPTDIYAALDEVFELQTIEHGEKKLRQYKTIQECPPILQVNIPRNTYDRATGRGVKIEHKVHLEETLYLDRYFEWEGSEIIRKREQSWGWRQQLEVLQAQRDVINRDVASGLDGPSRLKTAAKYIRNLQSCNAALEASDLPPFEIDDTIIDNLEHIAETQQTQLGLISEQITSLQTKIATSFEGHNQIAYKLAAVFFHRGGYGHGHYWTCIFDFKHSMWRMYNDEKVDKFEKINEIYDAETWQHGTPTYAVYVKEEQREEYIQPVCRVIEPQVQTDTEGVQREQVDEVMEDVPPPQPPRHPPPQPEAKMAWHSEGKSDRTW